MKPIKKDVVIIGGGPAGLAIANQLYKSGTKDIILLEREKELGGILRQCIHDGFGLTRFKESLTGPEYAQRFIDETVNLGIPIETEAMVISLTSDKIVTVATKKGLVTYEAKALVLAMGCRERTRGAIAIPGERPAGIMTAGVAQAYINLYNRMVGKKVVILGSGDIGLIMARRLTLEGAEVLGVYEIQPHPSGLNRNIEQCLNDFNIPLYLNHTVTEIHGHSRLNKLTVVQVDKNFQAIKGTEKEIEADTLVLSVGLIPENELSLEAGVALDSRTGGAMVDNNYETSVEGIFSIGNTLHVHDLVDFVSLEGERAGQAVNKYLNTYREEGQTIEIKTDDRISYTVPQRLRSEGIVTISFRVKSPLEEGAVQLRQNGQVLLEKKFMKAIPAEMMMVDLDSSLLRGHQAVEVTILC